jgi:hypothetical protein
MRWAKKQNENVKKTELYYRYELPGNNESIKKYTLPYGCKEVFLTYGILFPKYPQNFVEGVVFIESEERYIAKWELIWER